MSSVNVISIGSDRTLFDPASAARARIVAYAERLGELRVVIFSLKKHGLHEVHTGHLHLYPTNSRSKLLYIVDAARAARRMPGDVITVQDPFEAGLAGLLARKGRPLHVQLHTDIFAAQFAGGLNNLRLMIARFVLPRAARIRVVSARLAETLRKRYPRVPVSVLPIYVDIKHMRDVARSAHPRWCRSRCRRWPSCRAAAPWEAP